MTKGCLVSKRSDREGSAADVDFSKCDQMPGCFQIKYIPSLNCVPSIVAKD